jgi:glycerol uptake facilitator-like aquaporin
MKFPKPAIQKKWLIIISGLMWSTVGIFLNSLAWKWFPNLDLINPIIAYIIGGTGGATIAYFGFSKVAQKNIDRISELPDKPCLFAFQEWKSYILIAFMMSLGIFMRTSGIFPADMMAPMYIAIGSALFLASFNYYKYLLVNEKNL